MGAVLIVWHKTHGLNHWLPMGSSHGLKGTTRKAVQAWLYNRRCPVEHYRIFPLNSECSIAVMPADKAAFFVVA